MIYRLAKVEDVDILVELRKRQLADEGLIADKNIDVELHSFFAKKIKDQTMVTWVAEDDKVIIATAAIAFYEFPPTYTNKSGVKGYITNVYTRTEYRGRGIASLLLDKLVIEAKARKVEKLWLSSSKMGRPIYMKYGFEEARGWFELTL